MFQNNILLQIQELHFYLPMPLEQLIANMLNEQYYNLLLTIYHKPYIIITPICSFGCFWCHIVVSDWDITIFAYRRQLTDNELLNDE